MALARIITRSQACSRELALDLLARGYAVEIVSPDRVPDNIADLELRVDTGPGDQLIAKVETHDGQRSASLDFVHHLRAPMGDFKRRPPQPVEAVPAGEKPVSAKAGPRIAEPRIENAASPADSPQPAVQTACSTPEIPLRRELDLNPLDLNPEQGARPIVQQAPSVPPAVEPPLYFPVDDAAMVNATAVSPAIVPLDDAARPRDPSAGWRWRAALTFSIVVLLALALAFGMRRTRNPVEPGSGTGDEKAVAATPDPKSSIATDSRIDSAKPANVSGSALPAAAVNSEGNSAPLPKEAQVAKRGPAAIPHAQVSRKHGDDLIAHDTVIYLDKRFEPASKAKQAKALAPRRPKQRTRSGGVIAANSVTYLNKPAPKSAK